MSGPQFDPGEKVIGERELPSSLTYERPPLTFVQSLADPIPVESDHIARLERLPGVRPHDLLGRRAQRQSSRFDHERSGFDDDTIGASDQHPTPTDPAPIDDSQCGVLAAGPQHSQPGIYREDVKRVMRDCPRPHDVAEVQPITIEPASKTVPEGVAEGRQGNPIEQTVADPVGLHDRGGERIGQPVFEGDQLKIGKGPLECFRQGSQAWVDPALPEVVAQERGLGWPAEPELVGGVGEPGKTKRAGCVHHQTNVPRPEPGTTAEGHEKGPETRLIIGVGSSYRGDDGAGLAALERLPPEIARVACRGEPDALVDLWTGKTDVVIIDSIRSGRPPGQVVVVDLLADGAAVMSAVSSHWGGVPEAVALGRALGRLPSRLRLVGVEGRTFAMGAEMSSEVTAALDAAARLATTI